MKADLLAVVCGPSMREYCIGRDRDIIAGEFARTSSPSGLRSKRRIRRHWVRVLERASNSTRYSRGSFPEKRNTDIVAGNCHIFEGLTGQADWPGLMGG